jgi:DNA-binding XRE family transcriptional regulator
MLRHLIDDVTVIKGKDTVALHVRFRGGDTRSISLPRPMPSWKTWLTPAETVSQIDQLLAQFTYAQIADILNQRGFRSGRGQLFYGKIVSNIQRKYKLTTRYQRLRDRGMLSTEELASRIGVSCPTILRWRKDGVIEAHAYNDKHDFLYDPATNVPKPTPRWPRSNA